MWSFYGGLKQGLIPKYRLVLVSRSAQNLLEQMCKIQSFLFYAFYNLLAKIFQNNDKTFWDVSFKSRTKIPWFFKTHWNRNLVINKVIKLIPLLPTKHLQLAIFVFMHYSHATKTYTNVDLCINQLYCLFWIPHLSPSESTYFMDGRFKRENNFAIMWSFSPTLP